MANLHSRIQEASKEELVQILKAVCSFTDIHYHVKNVLDYLDDKKQSEAAAAAKRRLSTRASLSNKSWAQPLPKTVKRNIKMCSLCELPFVEKENTNESCQSHYGMLRSIRSVSCSMWSESMLTTCVRRDRQVASRVRE